MKKSLLFLLLMISGTHSYSQGFFSKELIGCIIELDKEDSAGNLIQHGVGFTLYNYGSSGEKIVTCAHVLKNRFIYVRIAATDSAINYLKRTNQNSITINSVLWSFDGYNLISKFELIKNKTFITDDNLDIAVFKLAIPQTVDIIEGNDRIKMKFLNSSSIPKSVMQMKENTEVGESIYFIGFPFNIGSKAGYYGSRLYSDDKINPLIRTGIVAWKSDKNKEFLLDASSYSGNSGSPIFTQNSPFGDTPKLIGMVIGHLSDPRYINDSVDFNYGLARCLWVDDILNLADKLK